MTLNPAVSLTTSQFRQT